MIKENLQFLIKEAQNNNFEIPREKFESLVDEEERNKVEAFLLEKKIYIVDEEDKTELQKMEDDLLTIPVEISRHTGSTFFNELSKYPKLSKIEEQELGSIYKRGIEAQRLLDDDKNNELSEFEKNELNKKAYNGEIARDKIVLSYTPLVVSLANKYCKTGANGKVPFIDLVMEAFTALNEKLSSFDFEYGNRFSTFAYFYAKNAIRGLVASLRNSVSINQTAMFNRMKICNTMREFETVHGREMTEDELAESFGIKNEKEKEKFLIRTRLLLKNSESTVQMDKNVAVKKKGDSKESTYGDLISSKEDDALEKFAKNSARKTLFKTFDVLDEKERTILLGFFGLGCDKRTLENLGKQYGITKERARQIKEAALEKIRVELKKHNNLDIKEILLS